MPITFRAYKTAAIERLICTANIGKTNTKTAQLTNGAKYSYAITPLCLP